MLFRKVGRMVNCTQHLPYLKVHSIIWDIIAKKRSKYEPPASTCNPRHSLINGGTKYFAVLLTGSSCSSIMIRTLSNDIGENQYILVNRRGPVLSS
jgi:hypothetical protein